jgi:hypothetical protein
MVLFASLVVVTFDKAVPARARAHGLRMHAHAGTRTRKITGLVLAAVSVGLFSLTLTSAKSAHAAGLCAGAAPSSVPANSWVQAHKQLVPAGALALRLCRYEGLNAPNSHAVASKLITGATLRKFVREFDALPRMKSGIFECPDDMGSAITAVFTYPHHHLTVLVETSGCVTASNGDISRAAGSLGGVNGERLLSALEAATGN